MSLLDDVSIVVTPNAYKAGTLYGVLPTATEGSDLVTNGDFATDSDWTKLNSSTISGGVGNVIANGDLANTGSNWSLNQDVGMVLGKRYKITFQARQTGGTGNFQVGQGYNKGFNQSITSSFENYTFYISVTSDYGANTGKITIGGATIGDTFEVDNVLVKEWTASDMDVTRATAATRVDENGLVNYAEILGSEEVTDGSFPTGTTAWSVGSAWSISDGSADYDDTAINSISQNLSLSSGKSYKIQFEVNDSTGTGARMKFGNSPDSVVFFNYEYYTNGKHSLYYNATSNTTDFNIKGHTNGSSFKLKNLSVKECTRDNVPRIDYTGGGCPHILAEPQRTNLQTYSEDFSNAFWTKTDSTVSSGFVSPSGDTTAYKMTATAANGQVRSGVTSSTVGNKAVSVFAKANTSTSKLKIVEANYFGTQATFDLNLGVIDSSSTTSSKIENYGNGWYRCTVIQAYSSGQTGIVWAFRSPTIDSLFLWGAQAEAGSYATSYIPTSGSAVTRNQDVFTRDGIASLINSTEGVLFLEVARLSSADNTSIIWSISDGSNSNAVSLYYASTGVKVDIFNSTGTKSLQHSMSLTEQANFNKLAIKYKSNDIALWVNGNEVATNTDAISLSGLNELIPSYGSGSFPFFGKVKQLQVYKTALTDAQLTSLTS